MFNTRKSEPDFFQFISRRQFLRGAMAASAWAATGCVSNPATGQSSLILMSKEDEIKIDRQQFPHQLSEDYGKSNDSELAAYVTQVGQKIAAVTHRPDMPYNFNVLDAAYVNAYAFPGGSIGITRAILCQMEDEATLGALIGHELGHVNARHQARKHAQNQMVNLALQVMVEVAKAKKGKQGALAAAMLGRFGRDTLLAKYSRDNEREADALALEYCAKANINPKGALSLMEVLMKLHTEKPGVMDLLYSTHPMSEERYQNAALGVVQKYKGLEGLERNRERYMDKTSRLRKIKPVVDQLTVADMLLEREKFMDAEALFKDAIKKLPNDYFALLRMSNCQMVLNNSSNAQSFAEQAMKAKPGEAQAYHALAMAQMHHKNFEGAYASFTQYEKLLSGNLNTIFYKGICADKAGDPRRAVGEYAYYLKYDSTSERAALVAKRLKQLGF